MPTSRRTTSCGYRRENGRVGVRNHVIVLPVDDLSNAAAEAVAHNIKGALAIPHPYGRLQFGADLELHFRTLIGAGCNPNVAAVVVIGIEDGWTKKVVDGIAATGKPVTGFGIERPRRSRHDHAGVEGGARVRAVGEREAARASARSPSSGCRPSAANRTRRRAAAPTRPSATRSTSSTPLGCTLVFGETTELTGGEQIVAARCRNDEVRAEFMRMFDRYQEVINRHKTSDLSDSQPTKGNIAGGLTTIEEKALGNIQKIGKKCMVDGVHRQGRDADASRACGSWTRRRAAAEMVTLCAASGYVVHFFPTGQGNVIGNPILPVIKICANPRTVRHDERARRRRHLGPAAARDHDRPGGRQAARMMLRTANGRLTAAEALGSSRIRADAAVRERLTFALLHPSRHGFC